VGDAAFRRKSSQRMGELIKDTGCSIVIVSHNMQLVEAIAEKTILLQKGKVVCAGDTKEVVPQYDYLMRPHHEKDGVTPEALPSGKDGALQLVKKYDGYGDDAIVLSKVWLESSKGNTKSTFATKEDCTLCISYAKVKEHVDIQKGYIWVAFINDMDANCMGTRLEFDGKKTHTLLQNKGVLRIHFQPMQLTTGSYKIAVHFFDETFTTPFVTGHYGYVTVINDIPVQTPGINTPYCWPACTYELQNH